MDHQLFTVLGISIFALGLFKWLRQINGNIRAVLFGVLIMSVSFKMTEIMRFPNAVHTAAWYPWILYAITKIMLARSLRSAVTNAALLIVFLVCLCTAGYPYYIFYSPFLFAPYMLVFLIKPLRTRFFASQVINWKRAIVTLIAAGGVAVLLCAPYLLGVKGLMAQTTDRTGKDFEYSVSHVFNYEDTIGSLVYPPFSQTEGWYFFSITGLLVVFLYLLIGKSGIGLQEKNTDGITKQACSRDLWAKLFLVIWIALISYISYGRSSYLFAFLWKYMPGFCSLRVWGRLNIILVPILAWLLSLAYESFESMISTKNVASTKRHRQALFPIITVAAVYLVILGTQLYLYLNKHYDFYWVEFFKNVASKDIYFVIYGAIAFVALLFFLILGGAIQLKSNKSLAIVLLILVLMAAVEMRGVGANMWTYGGQKPDKRIRIDVSKTNEASFAFRRYDSDSTISLRPNFSVGIVPNWYFDRYIKFLDKTKGEIGVRRVLLGVQDGTKIFFSESLIHDTAKSFLNDAIRYRGLWRVSSYSGDELSCQVDTPVAGYLSFIDNWDHGWKVFVDDKPVDMELLFGTFKSVKLDAGRHQITFIYQPGWLGRRVR